MALTLGVPGNWEELDHAFAALQTWIAKQEGQGRWVDVPFDATAFTIAGAGNSWSVPQAFGNKVSYTLINDTMLVNLYVAGSTLTASGTATNQVAVRLPDGYGVSGDLAASSRTIVAGRYYEAIGYISENNAATVGASRMSVSPDLPYLNIQRVTGANLADGVFKVTGQIALQVVCL